MCLIDDAIGEFILRDSGVTLDPLDVGGGGAACQIALDNFLDPHIGELELGTSASSGLESRANCGLGVRVNDYRLIQRTIL